MLNYEPITEAEAMAERFQLLKEGVYDAVILSSSDTQSKTGNPMMDITLGVYDDNGKEHQVRDFLVFTKAMMWKVIHLAESAGLKSEYEAGKLCSEIAVGKRVRVEIAIDPGKEIPQDKLKGKPAGSLYPDKNKVNNYLKLSTESDSKPIQFNDDDIAF